MRLRLIAASAALLMGVGTAFADTIAITGGRVMTATSRGTIENGTVIIENGRVVAVGSALSPPAGARVIDAKGKVVTPGFVASGTTLGIAEISTSPDPDEAGVHVEDLGGAAVDVQYQLNPSSTLLPIARLGGVTRAIVTPQAERSRKNAFAFGGRAAVVHLAEGSSMLVRPRAAMVLELGDPGAAFVALKAALEDVRAFAADRAAYDHGEMRELRLPREELEALLPVVQGRMPVVVNVDRAADIRQVLRFSREEKLKIILQGAAEGWLVAGDIAAARVPVMLTALADLPGSFDRLASTLDNAARLHAAGVTIVIQADRMGHIVRQLRFYAGNAVAHGLPYDAALAAITLNSARIWGETTFGTLAPGQDADVVVWSGDPFEPLTQPQAVLVRGVEQPLQARPLELRDRYRNIKQ
jgi:imidazolonepropionase-like amidohydrolase